MAKQLNCTTSIACTQNHAIHGIHFSPHTTFSRIRHFTNKCKPGLIHISDVDWTTSKSNHSNQQMPYNSSSLNSILGLAMIVGLKMTHISSEHYTTGIFSNISSSFWHIFHSRCTSILNWCSLLTVRVVQSTARWTRVIGGGIQRFNFLPERRMFQSYVHPTKRTWPIFQATSLPRCLIWQFVIFEKKSAAHLTWAPGLLSGLAHVHQKVWKTLTKHGILQLELCCLHWGILTSLA